MEYKYTKFGTPTNEGQLSFIDEMKECGKLIGGIVIALIALAVTIAIPVALFSHFGWWAIFLL